jgi:hypothetical protein
MVGTVDVDPKPASRGRPRHRCCDKSPINFLDEAETYCEEHVAVFDDVTVRLIDTVSAMRRDPALIYCFALTTAIGKSGTVGGRVMTGCCEPPVSSFTRFAT